MLLHRCTAVCQEHFTRVLEASAVSNEWTRLSVDDVVELLSCDRLNVPDESAVLDAALAWLNYDESTHPRHVHAARVLAAVKLPLLSPQV